MSYSVKFNPLVLGEVSVHLLQLFQDYGLESTERQDTFTYCVFLFHFLNSVKLESGYLLIIASSVAEVGAVLPLIIINLL